LCYNTNFNKKIGGIYANSWRKSILG
jgi:hypothetical protein